MGGRIERFVRVGYDNIANIYETTAKHTSTASLYRHGRKGLSPLNESSYGP